MIKKTKNRQIFKLIKLLMKERLNKYKKVKTFKNSIIFNSGYITILFKLVYKDNNYILTKHIFRNNNLKIVIDRVIFKSKDLTQLYFLIKNYELWSKLWNIIK